VGRDRGIACLASPAFNGIDVAQGLAGSAGRDSHIVRANTGTAATQPAYDFPDTPASANVAMPEWRRLLHHFYDPPPVIEHYAEALPLTE